MEVSLRFLLPQARIGKQGLHGVNKSAALSADQLCTVATDGRYASRLQCRHLGDPRIQATAIGGMIKLGPDAYWPTCLDDAEPGEELKPAMEWAAGFIAARCYGETAGETC